MVMETKEKIEQYKRIRAIYLERVKSCEDLLRQSNVPESEWSNHAGI